MRCLWKVKGVRRCRSPHRSAELAPQPRRPRSARDGLRGHRAAHVPVLRRGRDGHRRSRPRRERTYLAAAAPVPLMMRTICVLGGLRPLRCARTPFPVIRSCVKMSESNFNTPRRHQLAAQLLYHTLRPRLVKILIRSRRVLATLFFSKGRARSDAAGLPGGFRSARVGPFGLRGDARGRCRPRQERIAPTATPRPVLRRRKSARRRGSPCRCSPCCRRCFNTLPRRSPTRRVRCCMPG